MEAKDTILEFTEDEKMLLSETEQERLRLVRQAQAEISFEAGRKSRDSEIAEAHKAGYDEGFRLGFIDGQNNLFQADGILVSKIAEAKKEGMKEVMEFVLKHSSKPLCSHINPQVITFHSNFILEDWEAQLKEWGL